MIIKELLCLSVNVPYFWPYLLQSPVWDDQYVGTHRECGEKNVILVNLAEKYKMFARELHSFVSICCFFEHKGGSCF